ncbi:MAG: chaperone modulator CbpM [Betaproteobacteria bacterium]
MQDETVEAQWLQETNEISTEKLAELTGLPPDLLREIVDHGALTPTDPQSAQWTFAAECIGTVCAARRLRDDFELDANATSLALSLIERIHRLEVRLQEMQSQFPNVRNKR